MENTKLKEHYSTIKYKVKNFFYIIKSNVSERNRFLMISLASLFLFDYLLFCYISARNPFNIFPSFPLLEDKKLINVYLPDIDGKTILKETREISVPDDKKGYAKILIDLVIKGSIFENTSIAVPITLFNRKIWFSQDMCIIDFVPSMTADTKKNIADSDAAFKEALEKTISENIPSIKKIQLLERGIPGRVMWPQPN